MKHKIVIFIHAITIVLLQFIPKTIVLAAGVPGGGTYYYESFIYDFSHLWGMERFGIHLLPYFQSYLFALPLCY